MEKPIFDIAYKRKLLYKRKKRRQLISRISLLSLIICIFFIIYIINNKSSINKKVASINENKVIVCIDPGHGDWDVGAKSPLGYLEKDIVLDISLKLGELLNENNVKVVYTRTNDSLPWVDTANDSLKERIKISEILKSDLFVSIHCNSNPNNSDSKGVETWYKLNDKNSENLALDIQDSLTQLNYTEDRSLKTYNNKEDALAVLELNSSIPVLLELGFLSNSSDESYLSSGEGQESIAIAIKNSILNYIEENKDLF